MNAYDTDLLLWSRHQAALLRRRAARDLVNEDEVDWAHIAEEIEALGKSDRRELRHRRRSRPNWSRRVPRRRPASRRIPTRCGAIPAR